VAALLVAVMIRTGAGAGAGRGTSDAMGAARFAAPVAVARAAGTSESDAPDTRASAAAFAAPGRRRIWAHVEEAVAAAPPGSARGAGALGETAGREVAFEEAADREVVVEEAADREVAVEGAVAGAVVVKEVAVLGEVAVAGAASPDPPSLSSMAGGRGGHGGPRPAVAIGADAFAGEAARLAILTAVTISRWHLSPRLDEILWGPPTTRRFFYSGGRFFIRSARPATIYRRLTIRRTGFTPYETTAGPLR